MMKFAYVCSVLSLALVAVQFCSPVLAASADAHLKDAEQAFAEKRFHAAEDLLSAALVKNPTDQQAHLMLARTYVQLLDNKAAEREYSNCMKCNPFSSVGRMAHQEIINVGGRTSADKARPSDDVKTVTKSVDVINREAGDLKGDYGVRSTMMTPNYSQNARAVAMQASSQAAASRAADQAASRAARQAARQAARAARMAGAGAQVGIQAGAYAQPGISSAYAPPLVPSAATQPGLSVYGQPGATQTSVQDRIAAHKAQRDALRAARMSRLSQFSAVSNSTSPNGSLNTAFGGSPVAPRTIRSAMSMPTTGTQSLTTPASRSTFKSSYKVDDAQVQQMHKQQEDSQHAQYAQDSANNLQRLMSEKQNPNSPKLRALGTNLFVRYYGSHDQDGSTASAPAADPVVELKAKQMKLGDTK